MSPITQIMFMDLNSLILIYYITFRKIYKQTYISEHHVSYIASSFGESTLHNPLTTTSILSFNEYQLIRAYNLQNPIWSNVKFFSMMILSLNHVSTCLPTYLHWRGSSIFWCRGFINLFKPFEGITYLHPTMEKEQKQFLKSSVLLWRHWSR